MDRHPQGVRRLSLNPLLGFVILSAFTYRACRFLILDTLIDTTRQRFHLWLLGRTSKARAKIYELITCPYCLTIWVAGITIVVLDTATSSSIQWPPVMWLAVSAGALVFWTYIED